MVATNFANLSDGLQFLSLFDAAFATCAGYVAPTTVTTTTYSGPFTQGSDILVNRAGPVTITLPLSSTQSNFPISVVDISGAAATNNITIVMSGSDKFMGASSTTISTNYGGLTFWPRASGGYYLK